MKASPFRTIHLSSLLLCALLMTMQTVTAMGCFQPCAPATQVSPPQAACDTTCCENEAPTALSEPAADDCADCDRDCCVYTASTADSIFQSSLIKTPALVELEPPATVPQRIFNPTRCILPTPPPLQTPLYLLTCSLLR